MKKTICHILLDAKSRNPSWEAARYVDKGKWVSLTWPEYFDSCQQIAAGLSELGIKKGDKVAIFSNTRLEWAQSDMAILGLGAVAVPLYQSLTEEDLQFIVNDSESSVVLLENEEVYKKMTAVLDNCPSVKKIVHYESMATTSDNVLDLNSLKKLGENKLAEEPDFFVKSCNSRDSEELATICYTSGTTGNPKGVMLAHRQIMSEVSEIFEVLSVDENDRSLTFLPFAHIFGRVEHWGGILSGFCTAYAENIDRISSNLQDVRPTFLAAVPRIFEKIYGGIIAQAEASPVKSKIFKWAVSVGRKVSLARIQKRTLPMTTLIQYEAAKKLVFDKITAKLGGRMRFAISGGAPLSREIGEFFHAANLLVLEGYGLTETTAAITLNSPYAYQFGTVGKPVGDVEIKVAEDGELLVKSDKVMLGYYKRDDANKEAFKDGYFCTGDIGEFTKDGFVKITDRKKDLIKTAGGKYIAPQKLENLLRLSKYISNVLIHGDKKKYIVAVLTLNFPEVENYARTENISFKNKSELTQNKSVQQLIRNEIADANSKLASYETIKNFALLDKDFTVEDGELTPSLKVKRKYCDQKYADIIDELYTS